MGGFGEKGAVEAGGDLGDGAKARDFGGFDVLFFEFFEDAGEVFFDNFEAFFDGFAGVVFAAAGHDADEEFVFGDVEDDDLGDVAGEVFGDPFGLPKVAWEAVEDDVLAGLADGADFFVHDFDDFFVGDEVAFFEDFIEPTSVAEDLADGEPDPAVFFGEDLALSGFAAAGKAEQNNHNKFIVA